MLELLRLKPSGAHSVDAVERRPGSAEPLANILEGAFLAIESDACEPFSGVLVPSGNFAVEDIDAAIRSLASKASWKALLPSSSRTSILDRPFRVDQSIIDPSRSGRQWTVWFLTPHDFATDGEASLFPDESDLAMMRENRVIAHIPPKPGRKSIDLETHNLVRLLAPWSELQGLVSEVMSGKGIEGGRVNRLITHGVDERRLAVEGLRDPGARGGDEYLRMLYRHGRDLARVEAVLEQRIVTVTDDVRVSRNFPEEPDAAAADWFTGCQRASEWVIAGTKRARMELSELTTQGTQMAMFLSLAQTEYTKRVIGIIGVVVFLVGLTGLYVDSIQASSTVPGFNTRGAEFAFGALIVLGLYGCAVGLIWRTELPSRGIAKYFLVAAAALVLCAAIALVVSQVIAAAILFAMAGLAGAAAMQPD